MAYSPSIVAARLASQTPDMYLSDSPSTSRPHSGSPHSHSYSHSPSRHARNFSKSLDPLLRDLSPTSTLRAFTAAGSVASGKSEDQLARSIESASASERALGARIAATCKDIKDWYDEVVQWTWPGTFERPSHVDTPGQEQHPKQEAYWGCLPQHLVLSYEKRIEDIRDALEDRDVEELKMYILNAHAQPKASMADFAVDRRPSTTSITSKLQRLDDFTALITATILQALPCLSHLNHLLNTWSIRLAVLRAIPDYIQVLGNVQAEIDTSWAAMARDIEDNHAPSRLRQSFESLRDRLSKRIIKLGSRLDNMLDSLEGREETLPDVWIDAFETLEAAYGDWVTETEREIMTRELRSFRAKQRESLIMSQMPGFSLTDGAILPDVNELAAIQAAADGLIPDHDPINLPSNKVLDSSATAPAAPPTNMSSPGQLVLSPIPSTGTVKHADAIPAVIPKSPILGATLVADASNPDPEPLALESANKNPAGTDRASFSSLPEVHHSTNSSLQQPQSISAVPVRSIIRPRHVPIQISHEGKEVVSPVSSISEATDHSRSSSLNVTPSLPPEDFLRTVSNSSSVRARAAFLNIGLEQTQTLQKSPSPVRPFEHASQAFTKLFHRANAAAQHSRSSSASSRSSSIRKGLGISSKKDSTRVLDRERSSLTSLASSQGQATDTDSSRGAEPKLHGDLSISRAELSASSKDAFITPETHYGFEPSTTESKSTIESTWESPAMSDLAEDWPLPLRISEEEISHPKTPLSAEFFEKLFVDSLPTTPDGHEVGEVERERVVNAKSYSHRRVPTKDAAAEGHVLITNQGVLDSHTRLSNMDQRHVPRAVEKHPSSNLTTVPKVDMPVAFSSNLKTPEVQSASAGDYFGSKEVPTPLSRKSSADAAGFISSNRSQPSPSLNGSQHSPVLFRPGFSLSSQKSMEDPIAGSMGERRSSQDEVRLVAGRRASAASIESFSKSAVRTVDINRSPGYSSTHSPTDLTMSSSSPESTRSKTKGYHISTTAPSSPYACSDLENSLAANAFGASKPPPLNSTMPKRRPGLGTTLEVGPEMPSIRTTPVKKKKHKGNESGSEQLDRHVSRVLNSLPNRIRFTPTEFSSITEQPGAPEPTKTGSWRRPSIARKPSRSNLTLAPAQTDERKKSTSTDPEVKLYHLSQEGKEQPIKLYVRLVGENERVMVRVGGGWADLGEYLRQYAEHHGRRAVSDGRFEVSGVANAKASAASKMRIPLALSRPGSSAERPSSRLSQRRSSITMMQAWPEPPSFAVQSRESAVVTPTPPSTANASEGTPTSESTRSGSRPSTAEAGLSASSPSRHGGGSSDVGLAGPSWKKYTKELEPQKARWVEDMIEAAKQASTEKKRIEDKAWGDIGRIGGTRRVIFKQNQGIVGVGAGAGAGTPNGLVHHNSPHSPHRHHSKGTENGKGIARD